MADRSWRWRPTGLTVFEDLDRGVPFGQSGVSAQVPAQAQAQAPSVSFPFSFVPYQIGSVLDLASRALNVLGPQLRDMVRANGRVAGKDKGLEIMPGGGLRLEDGSSFRLGRRGNQVVILVETTTPEGHEVGYELDLGDPDQFRSLLDILRRSVSSSSSGVSSFSQVQQPKRVGLFEFMQSLPSEQRLMMMVMMFFLLNDLINGIFARNRSGGSGGGGGASAPVWSFPAPQGGGWYMWG